MKSKREKLLETKLGEFVQKYKRKAHAGHDPNDRSYDREIEQKIKNMSPEEFNNLLYGEENEE